MSAYKHHTLLSRQEERELIARAQAGDLAARNRMVEQNMRLLYKKARYFANKVQDPELEGDLVSEGVLAIIHAVGKFDLSRDIKFSTYASLWIQQRMSRYLYANQGCYHLSEHIRREALKVMNVLMEMQCRGEDIHDANLVCERTALPEEKIRYLLPLLLPHVSLDDHAPGTGGDVFDDTLAERLPGPPDEYDYGPNPVIEQMLESLPEPLRDVLSQRIGLHPEGRHTLAMVGRKYKMSKEGIRHQERRALRRLQEYVREYGITEDEILNGELVAG